MEPETRQQLLTSATVFLGILSSVLLLSAFKGDVEGIFGARDRRFVLLLLTVTATSSVFSSKVVGLVIGIFTLCLMVGLRYPPDEVDAGALVWTLIILGLFNAALYLLIRLDRQNSDGY